MHPNGIYKSLSLLNRIGDWSILWVCRLFPGRRGGLRCIRLNFCRRILFRRRNVKGSRVLVCQGYWKGLRVAVFDPQIAYEVDFWGLGFAYGRLRRRGRRRKKVPGKELGEKLYERSSFYPRMATSGRRNRTFRRPEISELIDCTETEHRRQRNTLTYKTLEAHSSRSPTVASILIPNTINVRVSRPTEDFPLPSWT